MEEREEERAENPPVKECPNCFYGLKEDEEECPNCGHLYSEPVGPTERERKKRRFKIAKTVTTLLLILITAAAAILGKTYGNWGYAALGLGLGIVLTFAVTFCMELAKWYVTDRPYESGDAEEKEEEETPNGGDTGDGGAH